MREGICKSGVNLMALALTVSLVPLAGWAANPINTVQDGRVVSGGTYYNTANSRTTFQNTGSGGLWIQGGSTVRGIEVDTNGNPTHNGGTLHFYAPGSVVRVDGNIDVGALRNNQGAALGNGGKVFIDSDYLFQSGHIFANGQRGGLVQINVAGVTLTPGASIQARGEGGTGGVVAINSSGLVDMQMQTLIDSSGRISSNFDRNVINIEGGLVNIEGIIRADGVAPQYGGSRGGTIRLVAGNMVDVDAMKRAWGNDTSVLTATQREQLSSRLDALYTGVHPAISHLRLYGEAGASTGPVVSANGTRGIPDASNDPAQTGQPRAGDGGTVMLISHEAIENTNGLVQANGAVGASGASPVRGGNGGTIIIAASGPVINQSQGQIEANGGRGGWSQTAAGAASGDGGLIAVSADRGFHNAGRLSANGAMGGDGLQPGRGGNGGLLVLNMLQNPNQNGLLEANAGIGGNAGSTLLGGQAGVIVSPNPATLQSGQTYTQRGYMNGSTVLHPATEQSQPFELLTHAENAILLTGDNRGQAYDYFVIQNLFNRLGMAKIRSVADPTGARGLARAEFIQKNTPANPYQYRNLFSASVWPNGVSLDMAPPLTPDSFGLDASNYFRKLNTLTIVDNGVVLTNNQQYQIPADFWVLGRDRGIFGGGRVSILSYTAEIGDPIGSTGGLASGGSVNIEADGIYGDRSMRSNALGLYTQGDLHGGSLMLKATGDTQGSDGTIFLGRTFNVEIGMHSRTGSQGTMLGGTVRMLAVRDVYFSHGLDLVANGGLQGGILAMTAGNNVFASGDGNYQADSSRGNGGFIRMQAGNGFLNMGLMEANGLRKGGTIALTAGDDAFRLYPHTGLLFFTADNTAFIIPGPLTPPVSLVTTGRVNKTMEGSLFNLGSIRATGGMTGGNGRVYLAGNSQIVLYNGSLLNNVHLDVTGATNSPNPNQAFQQNLLGLKANGGHVYAVTGQKVMSWLGNTRTAATAVLEAIRDRTEPDVNPNQQYQGSELPDDFSFMPAP